MDFSNNIDLGKQNISIPSQPETFSGDTSIDENINAQSPDIQIQDTQEQVQPELPKQESPEQYSNMNFTGLGNNRIIDKQNLS